MVRKIKDNQPKSLDDAIYLLDRGALKVPGAKTREDAVRALREQYGSGAKGQQDSDPQGTTGDASGQTSDEGDGNEDQDYESMSVKALQAEVDKRNADRDEEDQVAPEGRTKADIIAALEDDDAFHEED